MSWEVWSHICQSGLQRQTFEDEGSAQKALAKARWSSVLLEADKDVLQRKAGFLDFSGKGIEKILEQKKLLHGDVKTKGLWLVGSFSGDVRWNAFENEEEAKISYEEAWWSKVLLDPAGVAVKCSTSQFDARSLGVAAILACHQGGLQNWGRCTPDETNLVQAISRGERPFVPRERPMVVRAVLRLLVRWLFSRRAVAFFGSGPSSLRSLCFFDAWTYPGVRGYVALSIDDAPGRFGRPSSMLSEVRCLLKEHGAKATFMVMGHFVDDYEPELVELLQDGHELANHGMVDRAYHEDSKEDFSKAVEGCSKKLLQLQQTAKVQEGVRWFRAPHGKFSPTMEQILREKGLRNVMCDTYACCPVIQDGNFIGAHLSQRAENGSIILVHMPERCMRQWCMLALQRLLHGLKEKGLCAVSIGDLAARAGHEDRPSSSWA